MKRLFTLICVLCAVLGANAEKVLENVTWGAWSETTTVDGNKLSFSAAWAGAGFDARTEVISETDTTYLMADWSDYDYLVFEVSDAVGSFNLCVQYTENYDPSSNGSTGPNGYGAVELNGDYSDQVAQAWIQCTGVGSVTIDKLILMDEDEYAAYKESKKPQGDKVNLWTGEQTFGDGWPSIILGASGFEDAEEGDIVVVTLSSVDQSINPNWEYGSQIFFKNGDWSDLEEEMKLESIAEIGEVQVTLSAANLAIAKANGLVLQGMNVLVTQVALQAGTTSINEVKGTPAAMVGKMYNLSGAQVDASYKGIVIMNGKKYLNK